MGGDPRGGAQRQSDGTSARRDQLAVAVTVRGVESFRALRELLELAAHLPELVQPLLDLVQPLLDERAHVLTRRVASVADGEDLADLRQREPGCLCILDEPDPLDRLRVVVAVARRCPLRLRQQPSVFVEPQRLGRDPRPVGDLSDQHPASLTFRRGGTRTVPVMFR